MLSGWQHDATIRATQAYLDVDLGALRIGCLVPAPR